MGINSFNRRVLYEKINLIDNFILDSISYDGRCRYGRRGMRR